MDAAPTPRLGDRCSQQPPAELRPSSTARQALATSAQGPERRAELRASYPTARAMPAAPPGILKRNHRCWLTGR
ncbi:uncharacterized protein SCHCODRAFT_02522212 [Schizophyllum commune H4-8]|uniref:uncharacterized protein n=1 Tax=Schizophyllum commune (strain H4-8 / FGSC 9210) TaxID=578458 RepID=UPI002160977B|nr:uncharacterized protein SCHCODRAFT_02522212 [Schizophyllum commune H4-8]KAI5836608.1 hypothetical protein SCHCODRAFT_02522212 [Schizophyllum commune H4-8]